MTKSSKFQVPSSKSAIGFTLVEILISIAVVGIFSSVILLGYNAISSSADLRTATSQILDILNLARTRTTASLGSSSYGVHFEQSQFVMFKGTSYDVSDPDNVFYLLPDSVEIVEITLAGGGPDVVFDRISGKTSNNGTLKVRLKNNTPRYRIITVLLSGRSDTSESTQAPGGTRITDSRHVHFNYAQDIRSAVTLTLNFPGFLSQDITFQNYLDLFA